MKYIVIEIQVAADGTVAFPPLATYDDRLAAESKFHTVLASAAVSQLPKHTAVIFNENGVIFDSKCYEHPVLPANEPEEEGEPE